jgi:hypothetical protein
MRTKRIARSTTVAGVSAALTLAAVVVITPSAMADNSGRRVCLYGYSNQNTDTAHVTHYAVADYKKKLNRRTGGGSSRRDCPLANRPAFMAAVNWDDRNPYTWNTDRSSIDKIPCEKFLSDYLKGIVPTEFPEKRVDYFCDNTVDDTLYDFTVTTTRTNGQESVSVVVTNSRVKLNL